MKEKMKTSIWHQSIAHSNEILNMYYHPTNLEYTHSYAAHFCYFFRKDVQSEFLLFSDCKILELISQRWKNELAEVSSHKFRRADDLSMPFLHANVAIEECGGVEQHGGGVFGTWTGDRKQNNELWEKVGKQISFFVISRYGIVLLQNKLSVLALMMDSEMKKEEKLNLKPNTLANFSKSSFRFRQE